MTPRSPLHVTAARPMVVAIALALLVSAIPFATVQAATYLSLTGWEGDVAGSHWATIVQPHFADGAFDSTYRATLRVTSTDPQATVGFVYGGPEVPLPAERAMDSPTLNVYITFRTAGTQSITVTDISHPSLTVTSNGIRVVPAAPSQLVFHQVPTTGTAGAVLSPQPVVYANDAYGNVATNSPLLTVSLELWTVTPGVIGVPSCNGGLQMVTIGGLAAYSGCSVDRAGTFEWRAYATGLAPATGAYVTIGAPIIHTDHFTLVGDAPTNTWAESTYHRVGVYPRQSDGTVDLSYRGAIHFTSTDSAATLPAVYTFTAADAGYHEFDVMFGSVGPQTLAVTDTTNMSIFGTLAVTVVTAPPPPTATLDLGAPTPTITWGGSAILNLGFSGDGAGAAIGLYRIVRGSAEWVRIATLYADTAGKATFADRPALTSSYVAICEADCPGGASRIDSNRFDVLVRHSVSLAPVGRGHVTSVNAGTRVTYRATVRPVVAIARPRVMFSVYQKVRGAWVLRSTATVTASSSGVASYARRWSTRGEWYVRARALADLCNTTNLSAIERVIVR